MSGQLAYNLLTSMNTEEFLKVHGLVIAGSSAEPTAQFRIFDAGDKRYKIETEQGNRPAGAHPFDSYNVPMQVEEENGVTKVCIPVMHGVTLPAAGGPDIMVTGQLSGCSFVYLPLGNGGVKVTHIMPSGSPLSGTSGY